jgi:hypothetical protein
MKALCAIPILLAAGCYHPKIADGAFLCGEGQSCPEGFSCAADNHCHAGNENPDLSVDMAPSGAFVGTGALGVLDLSGMSGLLCANTDNGAMTLVPTDGVDGGMVTCARSGTMVLMPGPVGFQNLPQPSGGPHVGIWNFSKLIIPQEITVAPATSDMSALVLASTGELTIAGNIAFGGYGGFRGGVGLNGSSHNSGVASGGVGAPNDAAGSGGGGGGYREAGKSGAGPSGGMGGLSYGSATLVPLHMGSGGGGGSGGIMDGGAGVAPTGVGGFGGSAVALFGATVSLSGTIDVTGGAGANAAKLATTAEGGGGGGSGGSILVSGVSVLLDSGHDLLVAGGKGGSGTLGDGAFTGNAGGDGSAGRIWIGGTTVNITGSVKSDTSPVLGGNGSAVTSFPR